MRISDWSSDVCSSDLQQVCDALIPAMRAGSRIVIHATVHPQLCVSLAAQAARRDIALIDAPVSGGGAGAAAGTLTVMVGDRKSTRLNSSHSCASRMPSPA